MDMDAGPGSKYVPGNISSAVKNDNAAYPAGQQSLPENEQPFCSRRISVPASSERKI